MLSFYGAAGDAACGNLSGFALRKAAAALAFARTIKLPKETTDALYFAGILHAVGALENAASRGDVPVQGARICRRIRCLPSGTSDLVRWQAECWDGTGFPDQLRWESIPTASQLLLLAQTLLCSPDPDEALERVNAQSGRAFAPAVARTFVEWLHRCGGEIESVAAPLEALDPDADDASELLDAIVDRIDARNGVPERGRRLAALCDAAACTLALTPPQRHALAIAARVSGAGELTSPDAQSRRFDPLARLGMKERERHSVAAATLVETNPTLRQAAPILRACAEWYDGSGPSGVRGDDIPLGSRILAVAIAYDALEQPAQLEHAAPRQFDPRAVEAVARAARLLA